jgi:hypothetical protein
MLVTTVRYTALLALLGGVAAVITGVIIMTPETANGSGSVAPRPPGVNDIPGTGAAMEGVGSTVGSGVNTVDSAGDAVSR